MSDTGRQSFTDKAGAALKPDSEKSTPGSLLLFPLRVPTNLLFLCDIEHIGDKLKGAGDSLASTLQPQSEKSTTQQAGDTITGNQDGDQRTIVDKAKVGSHHVYIFSFSAVMDADETIFAHRTF